MVVIFMQKKIECKNFNTNILNDLYSEIKIENQL